MQPRAAFIGFHTRRPISEGKNLSVDNLRQGEADIVRCLRFTRAGVLWAGTPCGLFHFAKDRFQRVDAGNVQRIEEALNGHLLITTTHDLNRGG